MLLFSYVGPATVNYPPPKGKEPDVVYKHQTDANTPLLYRYVLSNNLHFTYFFHSKH